MFTCLPPCLSRSLLQITEPLEPVLIITKPDESKKGSKQQALICLPEDELTTVMPEVEKLLELRFQDEDE